MAMGVEPLGEQKTVEGVDEMMEEGSLAEGVLKIQQGHRRAPHLHLYHCMSEMVGMLHA